MDKDKMLKLLKSGNKDDIILGMHLLGNYEWEEIKQFFKDNFVEDTFNRFEYEECIVITHFIYGKHSIYVGQTLLTIEPGWSKYNSSIIVIK